MKLEKFDEFTYLILVNASQTAYIEDAQKTHSLLQQMNKLYRYLIRKENSAMLGDEMNALGIYLDIQASRYENRFHAMIQNSLTNQVVPVRHLCLLDFIDNILNTALAGYEDDFAIRIQLDMEERILFTAILESAGQKQLFQLIVPEE